MTKQASIPSEDSKPGTKKSKAKKPPVPSQADAGQRKCLTLNEKVEVIRKSNEGNSMKKLVQMFDCGKTQIVKILKQKARSLESWSSNEGIRSQKRLNGEKHAKISICCRNGIPDREHQTSLSTAPCYRRSGNYC